jgi:hypothetical protein
VNFHGDFLNLSWRCKNVLALWGYIFFFTKSLGKKSYAILSKKLNSFKQPQVYQKDSLKFLIFCFLWTGSTFTGKALIHSL